MVFLTGLCLINKNTRIRSVPKFVWKLKENRQIDAQQKQANQAIHINHNYLSSCLRAEIAEIWDLMSPLK